MKKILVAFVCLAAVAPFCPSANAGLVKGAVKGMGKGVKSVAGCADRGVKGTAKGVKSAAGGTGKAVKSVF